MQVKVTGLDGANGLEVLAADFAEAAKVAPEETRKVVQKGALNIKNDARKRISGLAHAPRYPMSITYDTMLTPGGGAAEIGPDKDKKGLQGSLGNVLEYGSKNNAPHPHLAPALEAERPKFEKSLEDLAVRAIGWR